jgi:hypothetical protein
MKRRLLSLLALPLLLLPGCLYAHVKTFLDTDLNQTKLGAKTGTSHAQQILWLVAWGDASTKAAAANGGITTINHADQEIFNVLWFVYTKQTTIVYGD